MRKMIKSFALALAVTLTVPVSIPAIDQAIIAEAAAAPKFAVKKKTINKGKTYTIKIKNKSKKYTYTWTTSKKKVATVNKNGKVKAKNAGTATIKCKVMEEDKLVKTLSCKITVLGAAKDIEITNANVVDGRHKLTVGEEYEFIAEMTPENNTDTIYWSSSNPEIATVDEDGLCIAIASGQAVIKAVAASSEEEAESSKVSTSVPIQVIGKEPEKTHSEPTITLEGSNQLKIQFKEAMSAPSLVNAVTKKLTNAVNIYSAQDSSGKYAASLGELKASMSEDGKTLTITSTSAFNGNYRISISNTALKADGTAFEEYVKVHTLEDKTPPTFVDFSLDDSGLIATLNFSEPLDINITRNADGTASSSTLNVVSVNSDSTTSPTLFSYLSTPTRYTLSEDKKSLILDLTGVADMLTSEDKRANNFTVVFSGIKDLAGNTPTNLTVECKFSLDATPKSQATILSVERTAYNKITVTYSRAIRDAGTLRVSSMNAKSPDSIEMASRKDKTKVEYTLDSGIYNLSGNQKITISYWNAYNTISTDTSSYNNYEYNMVFRDDTQKPAMISRDIQKETVNNIDFYNLTVTYSKPISLRNDMVSTTNQDDFSGSGVFSNVTIVRSSDGQTVSATTPIAYQAKVDGNKITYRISAYALDIKGTYTIRIPAGNIVDYSANPCADHSIVFVIG